MNDEVMFTCYRCKAVVPQSQAVLNNRGLSTMCPYCGKESLAVVQDPPEWLHELARTMRESGQ